MTSQIILAVIALVLSTAATAVVEIYTFADETERQRYQQFIEELRCPKCQNQNLAGSDSMVAADLRRELRRLLQEDRSDTEILDFMVGRYGDHVLYRPKLQRNTWVLWGGPIFLVALAILILTLILRHRKVGAAPRSAASSLSNELSNELPDELSKKEAQHLSQLLASQDGRKDVT